MPNARTTGSRRLCSASCGAYHSRCASRARLKKPPGWRVDREHRMFITKHALPRRTVLRGLGATLALPLLDAMVPALTPTVRTAGAPTKRFGAVFVPMGERPSHWTPATTGAGFEFSAILKPLEPFRDSVNVVSGLDRPLAGTHAVSTGTWLTGAAPKRTEAEDFIAGTSLDQIIAAQIGK